MPSLNRPSLSLFFAVLAASTQPAHAEPGELIDDLIVTAARVAVPSSTVGASISVIPREALETERHITVADALRLQPGIAVSRGGGHGAVTQARMRGAEGNHTLVLIDGVEANNPVNNSEFDFANLLAADIERIEILRGAQSALYGSEAIGGVVHVITRRPVDDARIDAHAETGTFDTRKLGFSASTAAGRMSGGVAIASFATDGENIAREGNEADGYSNDTISLRGDAHPSEALTLSASLRYIDAEQDFDSQDFSFPPSPTQGLVIDDDVSGALEQWFLRVEAEITGEESPWQHRFAVSRTDTDNRFFDGGGLTGGNAAQKDKLELQSTIVFTAAQSVTLAVEREQVDYSNRGAAPDALENQERSDEQTSLIGEYRVRLGRADLAVGARGDDNELFQDASTFRGTLSFALDDLTRLHGSLGTGVANPGFFELFGFFPDSFIGNPELRPEQSESVDVGIERQFGRRGFILDATYFRANLEDEILTTFDAETFLSTVVNLAGKSERRGVELALDAPLADWWRLRASYTYTDADQPDGEAELRRPRHLGSVSSTFALRSGRARIHFGAVFNGEQEDSEFIFATPEDRVTLEQFTVLNLAADYRISPRWQLYGRIDYDLDEE
jgi:vitamin B12 transporter